jgi:hypothetical protein
MLSLLDVSPCPVLEDESEEPVRAVIRRRRRARLRRPDRGRGGRPRASQRRPTPSVDLHEKIHPGPEASMVPERGLGRGECGRAAGGAKQEWRVADKQW